MRLSKNKLYIILCILVTTLITSCAPKNDITKKPDNTSIVCTYFYQYDWVENLTKGMNNIDLIYLLESGTDIHSYQASADDIIKINNADLLVLNGTSDAAILNAATNSNMDDKKIVTLMSLITDKLLLIGEDEHDHEEDHAENCEYDEHIWLSLKNAVTLIPALKDHLIDLFPENRDLIQANADEYISRLSALDSEYQEKISASKRSCMLIADRFPLRYLANDYSIECFTAFDGCSSETEASFNKVLELSAKADENDIDAMIILENGNQDIANSIISNTKTKSQKILSVNSMQSISKSDIDSNLSYIEEMKKNLDTIVLALN